MKSCMVLSSLFVFILINSSKAQSGYVVTKKNDTIYCRVKLNATLDPQYQSPGDNKFHNIRVKKFNGYRLTGFPYALTLKDAGRNHKHIFVTGLVLGRLNLYQETGDFKDENANWITYTKYYVSKPGDSLTQFANDQFIPKHGKQIFHDMLADNPKLAEAFHNEKNLSEHGKFDIQKIMQYVRDYNKSR
jgi:hypothetical protein